MSNMNFSPLAGISVTDPALTIGDRNIMLCDTDVLGRSRSGFTAGVFGQCFIVSVLGQIVHLFSVWRSQVPERNINAPPKF